MARKLIAVALAVTGIGALGVAITGRATVASIFVSVVLLFLAATLLSTARSLALALRQLVGRPVVVAAWGAPLPANAPTLIVTSVSSFGAGLLIRLQNGERAELLKVAQPQRATFQSGKLVVPEAAYVQWAGKRLARQAGHQALVLWAAA